MTTLNSSFQKNPWKTLSNDPTFDRGYFAIAAHDNRYIFMAGGKNHARSVVKFDIETHQSIDLPDLPRPFSKCAGAILDGYLYIISCTGNCPVYRLNISIDISIDIDLCSAKKWEKVFYDGYKYNQGCCSVVSDGTSLYSFSFKGNEVFLPGMNKWVDLPHMKKIMCDQATIIAGQDIYIIGGDMDYSDRYILSVEVFNIHTHKWKTAPNIPIYLWDVAAVVVDERWIVVTGGQKQHDSCSTKCFVFDIQTSEWMESKVQLTTPHVKHGSVLIEQSLVLVGGSHCDFTHSDSDSYTSITSITSNSTSTSTLPSPKPSPSIESINVAQVIPNWLILKHLVLLRRLVDEGRAHPDFDYKDKQKHKHKHKQNEHDESWNPNELAIFQKLMTDLHLDAFRSVISFLVPPLYQRMTVQS